MIHHRHGFTLIEVTIVIAIFGILAGLVISNLGRGERSQELQTATLTLVDDIRQAQNMTLVGTTIPVCHVYDDLGELDRVSSDCTELGAACGGVVPLGWSTECKSIVPPGGYGINFPDDALPNQYRIFADFSDTVRNSVTGVPVLYEGSGSSDTLLKIVTLPENISLIGVQVEGQFTQDAGIGANPDCFFDEGVERELLGTEDLSITWIKPEGKLYGVLHEIYPLVSGACPDEIYRILLRHDRINYCRMITVNGATGLVDEEANSTCTFP